MLKTFPIDFIRQTLEQKLAMEHTRDTDLFGGKDQVNIFSFYEQLKSQEEVDRFVQNYRELTKQQNKSGLILNGVLVAPENPTITNLYSSTIIPMAWTCSMRTILENRDQSIVTINNLIDKLKGKKVDIAQLNCTDENGNKYAEPFMVGTIGQTDNDPFIKDGDFIGEVATMSAYYVVDRLNQLKAKGIYLEQGQNRRWNLYVEHEGKIKVVQLYPEHHPVKLLHDKRFRFVVWQIKNSGV